MPGWLWFAAIWLFLALVVCLIWAVFFAPIREMEDERER